MFDKNQTHILDKLVQTLVLNIISIIINSVYTTKKCV